MEVKQLKLTAGETELADWALGPMDEYWTDEDEAVARDGEVYSPDYLPKLNGNILTLSAVDEINEDFRYRIEIQMADMIGSNSSVLAPEARAQQRIINSLAKKLEAAGVESGE